MHRIRLRGPWQYEWTDPLGDAPFARSGRLKMPADWQSLFGDRAGSARFSRMFHRPTNLEPHERVFLVLEQAAGVAHVWLNEVRIGTVQERIEKSRFEITGLLRPANELVIDVRFDPRQNDSYELWSEVALEIESHVVGGEP